MGFYDDKILPRLIEKTCGMPQMDKLRRHACAPLHGDVVEIGFGSGFNVGQYPDAVTSVVGIEPSDVGWERAQLRVASSSIPISRGGLDGQRIPFPDDTFDSALSTFTLCTVPDIAAALTELRRVVKPGGTLAFLEHGTAPDSGVRRVQRMLDPIERLVAGGCELTRDTAAQVRAAGWRIEELEQFYAKAAPKPWAAFSRGYAVDPG
ncbi:class I SAM-dependent methyltransferase [Gordonia sp. (in: high G+C Gram-positive bacteria)]|uniref:class I SAM-dependent methyltransferase n=1 Tax=unclassified Gordonia (in: high G+C Gram-positive bacteria) TaxID=2657482 RepID=UPI002604F7C5|nr:class I SAM-dependent methyltransferase [Gordonia sp. (in: high G+C Gram-positive bacteria)]